MATSKKEQRLRRARQTRARIALQGAVRLTVFRTNLHIYASVISGDGSKVLASACSAAVWRARKLPYSPSTRAGEGCPQVSGVTVQATSEALQDRASTAPSASASCPP